MGNEKLYILSCADCGKLMESTDPCTNERVICQSCADRYKLNLNAISNAGMQGNLAGEKLKNIYKTGLTLKECTQALVDLSNWTDQSKYKFNSK